VATVRVARVVIAAVSTAAAARRAGSNPRKDR
jgi:hypothetical protein